MRPSIVERTIGIVFAVLIFALIAYTIVSDVNVADNKLPLLYVLIALMAGVVVATIPGFLNIDYSGKGMTMRAAGGVAAFILVLSAIPEMIPAPSPNPSPNPSPYNASENKSVPITPVRVPGNFFATSYCSMTNVYGFGESSDITTSQNMAIDDCIYNGGIPDCCAGNVRVSQ